MTYLFIALVVAVIIALIAERMTTPIYYKPTAGGWQIKYGFANQAITSFLLLWGCASLLLFAYFDKDCVPYRDIIKVALVIVTIFCIAYAVEKKMKAAYISFNEKEGTIKHGTEKIYLADIDHFEYQRVKGKSDEGDYIYMYVCLKNGGKKQLDTSAHSLSGRDSMYLSAVRLLAKHTGIDHTERNE